MKLPILLTSLLFIGSYINAQQLVYKPINSAFGGDNYNYNWLLSSANAQNQFKVDMGFNNFKQNTAVSSFEDNLHRQLLNKLTTGLTGTGYNDGGFEPGVYNLGNLYVTIKDYFGGLNISVIDTKTGEQTNINLPNSY
ncbi:MULTISPECIES: curli assembly protein CsgF [Empedobacter]|jgi:curli production assembly/transport component CsgF|uniref:Curli production assembly/transport component CsgF n=1 Tax=Empedobacter falsenii TaxID=343874 RepID=A0AAW7DE89_9FLAO|nr:MULTISPECIES: curli assembly protein CsgF [Empedobacter]MDH1884195.1 curli assembly protein CsgF [Empedobacter sp. GD03797]MDM1549786.1 curli assembly protein CsgF [Empedobacter falsenii]